jgi:hypothetical protein
LFAASQELPVMQTGRLGEQDFTANMDFKLRAHTQTPFSQPQFSGQLTQRCVFGSTNFPAPQEQAERLASHEAPAAQETQVFLCEFQCFPSGQAPLSPVGLLGWAGCGAVADGVFCAAVGCWLGQVSFWSH